jgi:hypothetical protein
MTNEEKTITEGELDDDLAELFKKIQKKHNKIKAGKVDFSQWQDMILTLHDLVSEWQTDELVSLVDRLIEVNNNVEDNKRSSWLSAMEKLEKNFEFGQFFGK